MSAPSSTTIEMADPIDEAEALRRLRATDDPSAQYYARLFDTTYAADDLTS